MAEAVTFATEIRELSNKGARRRLRIQGRTPGVIFGGRADQLMISVETRQLRRALLDPHFPSTICSLEVNGKAIRALPREIQLDPVKDEPIHIDFERVARGGRVSVTVPVRFENEGASPGIKRGGVLNIVRHDVEIECPAEAIPSEITLDLGGFDINDSLHISNARLPEGVTPTITDRDFTIATISAPSGGVKAEDGEDGAGEEG